MILLNQNLEVCISLLKRFPTDSSSGEIYRLDKNKCDESGRVHIEKFFKGEIHELSPDLLQEYKEDSTNEKLPVTFLVKQQAPLRNRTNMRCGIVYDPYMCLHDGMHPESPARFVISNQI